MRCPKCGYTSFDHYLTCPKCRKDLAAVRQMLNLTAPAPGATDFFHTASRRAAVPEPFLEPGPATASGPVAAFAPAASLVPAFAATIIINEEVFDDLDGAGEKSPADSRGGLDPDELKG